MYHVDKRPGVRGRHDRARCEGWLRPPPFSMTNLATTGMQAGKWLPRFGPCRGNAGGTGRTLTFSDVAEGNGPTHEPRPWPVDWTPTASWLAPLWWEVCCLGHARQHQSPQRQSGCLYVFINEWGHPGLANCDRVGVTRWPQMVDQRGLLRAGTLVCRVRRLAERQGLCRWLGIVTL